MSKMNLYVVVYDISNDKRRTKLHNKLLDYGAPVQYSVFECHLDKKLKEQMDIVIKKTIKPNKDLLRTYSICEECEKKIEMTRANRNQKEGTGGIILVG